jgi:hypothetical protein
MFLRYERTLLPDYLGEESFERGYEAPFVAESERKAMLLRAYKDLQYQNLLIRNHYWLERVSNNGRNLLKEYEQIVRTLENEVEEK